MMRSNLFRRRARSSKTASWLARSALLACIAVAAMDALSANASTETELLPARGRLRVGVYPALERPRCEQISRPLDTVVPDAEGCQGG